MSRSAPRSVSESIDGITRRRRAQMRLERFAIDHVHRAVEQTRNVLFETHVVVDRSVSVGLELHEYVQIAVRPVVTPRNRAEHGGVADPARAQTALVAAKSCECVLSVHARNIAQEST